MALRSLVRPPAGLPRHRCLLNGAPPKRYRLLTRSLNRDFDPDRGSWLYTMNCPKHGDRSHLSMRRAASRIFPDLVDSVINLGEAINPGLPW